MITPFTEIGSSLRGGKHIRNVWSTGVNVCGCKFITDVMICMILYLSTLHWLYKSWLIVNSVYILRTFKTVSIVFLLVYTSSSVFSIYIYIYGERGKREEKERMEKRDIRRGIERDSNVPRTLVTLICLCLCPLQLHGSDVYQTYMRLLYPTRYNTRNTVVFLNLRVNIFPDFMSFVFFSAVI